jgi:thiamine biosynthesis lipoprotein
VIASTAFAALGTTATVAVEDAGKLDEARDRLAAQLAELDAACSRFRPDSELVQVPAGVATPVSRLLAQTVAVALDVAADTGGLVVPTLGASLAAAGYDRTFRLVRLRDGWTFTPVRPDPEAWRSVHVDVEACTLHVPEGVELDLGATAKAFAADRAAVLLAAALGCGVLVSLGGDVAVAGDCPPAGWPVLIAEDHASPLDASGPRVAIRTGGLATSSTAVRRWQTDRGAAHHVIDPRTGEPAVTPWRTVTVAATSCVAANAAALAAILLGHDAPAFLAARRLHTRLVAETGAVSYTGDWPREELAA